MDILAGDMAPDTGSVSRQRNVTLGYLKQEPDSFTGKPLLQEVLDAGSEVNTLVSEIAAVQEGLSSEADPVQQATCWSASASLTWSWRRPAETTESTRPRLCSRALVLSRPTFSGP